MSVFYVAKDVLATKSAFLLLGSTPLKPDVVDGLIPRLVFDASQLPSDVVVNDEDDADIVADNDNAVADGAITGRHVDPHMADLSNEAKVSFPYTIRYLDLTGLELKQDFLVPHLMLFRNEWDDMIDIFNKRTNDIQGSAVFTGQPGICEHYYWYLIIISNQ